MSHYYSEEQNVASNPVHFTYTYEESKLELKTDSGVFSKGSIDFGSDLLVRVFLKESVGDASILDVGCGYGPIGLMVAKIHPENRVHMIDVNGRALELAQLNAQNNGISNVTIYKSDALDSVASSFDAVLTNPPIRAGKEVVNKILDQSYDKLNTKGALYVVIQKKQGMPSAKKRMTELFGNIEVLAKDKGYYILKSVKG
ncbi:class I SAM-dependent methyltransferase [Macrococcus hajekii]|uniref:Class I SAM-dependent methyltransferase n=1 Tax=Macrococcus hajekii TaxID=198482 RepID=A0A4R6BI79_9STAP|nr:class I SAM-dependent methyltransferase [Macrococcus hajekii]TDM01231.1 class I SAM-dependent methyltransferase [Macrococcus hajekii]GGB11481.1 methyltransferase [Macrococcus hajekii]